MLATLLRITRWTLDRGVWVRALVGSFRFIAGKENEMLKDNLRWVSIPSRVKEGGGGGRRNKRSRATGPWINIGSDRLPDSLINPPPLLPCLTRL